jgi:hypothetical protein
MSKESLLEYRCPDCLSIPFILVNSDNKLAMNMKLKCINEHEYNGDFFEISKKCKIDFLNEPCKKCGKKSDPSKKNSKLFYCCSCYKIFCHDCSEEHEEEKCSDNQVEHDKLINIKKMDSRCMKHENTFSSYCPNHKKNFCNGCNEHENEENVIKIKKLSQNDIDIFNENIKESERNLMVIENTFNDYAKLTEQFKNDYSKYISNEKTKINFIKELIEIYNKKLNENNLNYQVIYNIYANQFSNNNLIDELNNKINDQIKGLNNILNLIQYHSYEKIEYINESHIVYDNEIELIKNWLSPSSANNNENGTTIFFELIYRASRDGDDSNNFHMKCDNKGKTITFIKNNLGYRFGGYTSVPWERYTEYEYKQDPTAFLFSLNNKEKYNLKDKNDYKAVRHYYNNGPVFGGGNDLFILNNCLSSEENGCGSCSFDFKTIDLSGKEPTEFDTFHKFKIEDYEVFLIKMK